MVSPQHRAVLELRKGSRTTPVDRKHVNRARQKRAWRKEQQIPKSR